MRDAMATCACGQTEVLVYRSDTGVVRGSKTRSTPNGSNHGYLSCVVYRDENSPVESGRRGGLRRAERLTPARRSEIARQAAHARWGKR